MKSIVFLIITISFFFSSSSNQQVNESLNEDIQKEIALIKATGFIINNYGNSIWENISSTPLRILLITDSLEYLFNHSNPDESFELFRYDSTLSTNIYVRHRRFPPFLRATFPAVNGADCIVVGDTKNTQKSDEDWIIMLLHEHFHLYQGINPQYNENISFLAQKIGNESDNWMLDYDFPYNDTIINKLFKEYSNSIYKTYFSLDKNDFREKVKQQTIKISEVKNFLPSNDYNYFQFQIWQEGIATYTEYKYLQALNQNSKFLEKIYALNFNLKDEELLRVYIKSIQKNDLQESKRNLFYSIGLLVGIIKDETNPQWRKDYFKALNVE